MYARILNYPQSQSFFLFGPRGVGKSTWVRNCFPDAVNIDLLHDGIFRELSASPGRIVEHIPSNYQGWVIIDEVQKIPQLLDTVHMLIEKRDLKFILTGSSARKLRRGGVNLLAGRALTRNMHPLTFEELGESSDLEFCLNYGCLPFVFKAESPRDYLSSYIGNYIREEVLQEGFTRNIGGFSRFLETASLSQASLLNMSSVSRDCSIPLKTVQEYFAILEDLLIAVRIPVFNARARRKVSSHPKFLFFDCGVYRTLRPRGPLDTITEIDGPALETLFFQQARAINDAHGLGYGFHYWRDAKGNEVDFVLYGEKGFHAFEIKRAHIIRDEDFAGLRAFKHEYPEAKCAIVYTGLEEHHGDIPVIPIISALPRLKNILGG